MSGSQVSLGAARGNTGATGPAGAAGPGADGVWQPAENGLVAAPTDPLFASTQFVAGAGILYLVRVKVAVDSVITNAHALPRTPAGAGLANTYLGVYAVGASTATLLGQTADCSGAVQTGGEVKVALTAPTASQAAGTTLLLGFLCGSGTTMPTIRSVTQGVPNANFLTGTSPYRTATFGTGQTALPSSITLSSLSAAGQFPWLGLS